MELRRGEVWWTALGPDAGARPVLLLSRDEAYVVRRLATVAPITTRVRSLPVEVPLGPREGLPKSCVVNLDTITTIPLHALRERVTALPPAKVREVNAALRFALAIP